MDERILKWLFDIKMSVDEINSYFEKEEKDFFKYQNNLMLNNIFEILKIISIDRVFVFFIFILFIFFLLQTQ